MNFEPARAVRCQLIRKIPSMSKNNPDKEEGLLNSLLPSLLRHC